MAHSKSFFGMRTGSTKNFTFAIFNGKQITKEKAEQVKNPRTLAQMRNRMILTTSAAAYSAMKEIVDHSFQGYTYGLQNMARFQSLNNKALRENLGVTPSQFAYCEFGKSKLYPGAFIMSEGSANAVPNGFAQTVVQPTNAIDFYFGTTGHNNEYTLQQWATEAGVQVGDLLTLTSIAFDKNVGEFRFDFVRVYINKLADVVPTSANIGDYLTIESDDVDATVTYDRGQLIVTSSQTVYDPDKASSYACIHSKLANGIWQRSDSKMTVVNATALEPAFEEAIITYPVGGSYILNNGDIENGITLAGGSSDGGGEEPDPSPEP